MACSSQVAARLGCTQYKVRRGQSSSSSARRQGRSFAGRQQESDGHMWGLCAPLSCGPSCAAARCVGEAAMDASQHSAASGGTCSEGAQVFILNTLTSSLWHSSAASAACLQAASAHCRPCMDPAAQPTVASLLCDTACGRACTSVHKQCCYPLT